MNWNTWMRQTHRWLSMIFTVLVIINVVINLIPLGQTITLWVGLATLLPLLLLLATGLYLFILPYRRSARRAN